MTSPKQRKPWQSLRLQLVAWYSLLAGLSMVISDGLMYLEFHRSLLAQVDNSLEVTAIQAMKNIDDEIDILAFDPRQDAPVLATLLDEAGVSVYLLSADGQIKEGFGDAFVLHPHLPLRSGYRTVQTDNGRWRIYTQQILPRDGRPSGWLKVAHSLRSVDATARDLLKHHLLEIPLVLGMVGLGGLVLANRGLKPIEKITRMAEQIRVSGDLSQRLNHQGAVNELQRLTTMFDEMLDSLQATFNREKRFTADASHELRTPLTALKGRLYVTLSHSRTPEEYEDTLQTISQEVDRLIRLSSDLLLLSQLEQHSDWHCEMINLSELLEAIAEQMQPLADLHDLHLSTDIAPDLQVQGSPDHLIRLFLNLLDNAVKHTPAQGTILLKAMCQERAIQVMVSDTGVGISSEHLPHLFERFYRVEASRSRSIGGTGLGLAIAHQIVQAHTGQISVTSTPGVGSTFQITFPSAEQTLSSSTAHHHTIESASLS